VPSRKLARGQPEVATILRVRREWEPEDLIACWTLVDADWKLVANKRGATRLDFALLLSSSSSRPGSRGTQAVPAAAVSYVASQVKVPKDFSQESGYPPSSLWIKDPNHSRPAQVPPTAKRTHGAS
jgi:Domain of unknown function (DUF4158)